MGEHTIESRVARLERELSIVVDEPNIAHQVKYNAEMIQAGGRELDKQVEHGRRELDSLKRAVFQLTMTVNHVIDSVVAVRSRPCVVRWREFNRELNTYQDLEKPGKWWRWASIMDPDHGALVTAGIVELPGGDIITPDQERIKFVDGEKEEGPGKKKA